MHNEATQNLSLLLKWSTDYSDRSYFASSSSIFFLMFAAAASLSILEMGMILSSSYNSFGSYDNTSQTYTKVSLYTFD